MKVIVKGHQYLLESYNNESEEQGLQFIHKEPKSKKSTELKTIAGGTTNEEVLRVLIDRLDFLNKSLPSEQTAAAKQYLENALGLLEHRTADREARKVEGTQKA